MKGIFKKKAPIGLLLSGATVLTLGAILGWYGFPKLVRSQIASNLALREGSDRRKIWEKAPFPIDFKVYLFNITNPLEVEAGEKPVVDEVGPFCYDQYKEKVHIVDNEDDDTVEFSRKETWFFNQNKSGGLTGDEIVRVPHLPMLAMLFAAEEEHPAAVRLVLQATPHIFGNINSVFLTAPAKSFIFDGIILNCTSSNFSVKVVCSEIRRRTDFLSPVKENIFKFSLLGMKNGTLQGRYRVKRGIDNIKDVGRVVEYNGQQQQKIWKSEKCDRFLGTDTTIFPPFLTKEDKIEAFAPELCRSSAANYSGTAYYKGIRGYRYTGDFGDPSNDPDLKCFCTTQKTCLKKGVHDLTKCTGVPLIASFPHFYLADKSYLEEVGGLSPSQDKHELSIHFEPLTATPLSAYKRLQLSLAVHKVDDVDVMKNIPQAVLPIVWFQESLELRQEYLEKLTSLYVLLTIMAALKWILIASGGALAAGGLFFMIRGDDNVVVFSSPEMPRKVTQ